jgi:hypothetical protein
VSLDRTCSRGSQKNLEAAGTATPEPVGKVYESGVEDTTTPQQPGQTPAVPEHIRGAKPFEKWERDEMEKMLETLCGHLGENLAVYRMRKF